MYNVVIEEQYGEKRITGYIGASEIIIIGIHANRKPTVMMSSCLPSDIHDAEQYVNCMKAAFTKYNRIIKHMKGDMQWLTDLKN